MLKISIVILTLVSFICGWLVRSFLIEDEIPEVLKSVVVLGQNFDKYSIENLSKTEIEPSKLKILNVLNEEDDFIEYLFELEFKPDPLKDELKKTTGQINIPKIGGDLPLIVMLRGYIDQDKFITGDGTRNASRVFADNGYITIAPDFLGYGGSDEEAGNIFETRFQTYTTVLSLIKTIKALPNNTSLLQVNKEILNSSQLANQLINYSPVFIWGHSNGGHVALIILTITGASYPTTLWAPVTKPFPYSVLYYTDQSADGGKLIRKELAKFEEGNNVESFSLTNYLDKINAPIQIQQGNIDDAVPVSWSNSFVNKLKDSEKDITYHTYPNTDHNMRPSWDEVVQRDLEFFKNHLK